MIYKNTRGIIMANDNFFKGFDPANMPSLDLSHTISLASGIQAQIDESNRRTQQIGEEAYKNRQKMQQALEQTAINTAETNTQLQETNTRLEKIIDSQQEYIDLLKNQLTVQQQQLDLDEKQLSILKNIFASGEDGVVVEKEIMKLIQEQIDSNHPLWDYVKDKGGDLAVAGITAGTPVIYAAIKQYLASKGIILL